MTLALSLGGHVKPVSRFAIGFHSAPPFFGYFHSGELSPPKKNPLFLFLFFFLFVFCKRHFFPGKRFHNASAKLSAQDRIFPCDPQWNCANEFPARLAVLAQLEWNSGTVAAGSQRAERRSAESRQPDSPSPDCDALK